MCSACALLQQFPAPLPPGRRIVDSRRRDCVSYLGPHKRLDTRELRQQWKQEMEARYDQGGRLPNPRILGDAEKDNTFPNVKK